MKLTIFLSLTLAACSTPLAQHSYLPDHPANQEASASPAYAPRALAPAPDATPPPPLAGRLDVVAGHGRMGDEMPATDHSMAKGAPVQHEAAHETAPSARLAELAPEGEAVLRRAIEAYLAIGDRLASDQIEGVAGEARRFGSAIAALSTVDVARQPHFWHERAALLSTLKTQSAALAAAGDLSTARQAFGQIGPAVSELISATGTPQDMPVRRFVCGMYEQAPEGGVWLQQGAEARNPFFGSKMLRCHRTQQPLPVKGDTAQRSERPNHDGHH